MKYLFSCGFSFELIMLIAYLFLTSLLAAAASINLIVTNKEYVKLSYKLGGKFRCGVLWWITKSFLRDLIELPFITPIYTWVLIKKAFKKLIIGN